MKKYTQQEMIDQIIENFDFDKMVRVMYDLNWKWAGNKDTPTRKELVKCATRLLHSAIEQATNPDNTEHVDIGWISGSGGFKATAFRTKKWNLAQLHLEFVVTEWESERKR
jgi:hypothetical protein